VAFLIHFGSLWATLLPLEHRGLYCKQLIVLGAFLYFSQLKNIDERINFTALNRLKLQNKDYMTNAD
jgi:hypothetical protein